jgi:hypothetical protein
MGVVSWACKTHNKFFPLPTETGEARIRLILLILRQWQKTWSQTRDCCIYNWRCTYICRSVYTKNKFCVVRLNLCRTTKIEALYFLPTFVLCNQILSFCKQNFYVCSRLDCFYKVEEIFLCLKCTMWVVTRLVVRCYSDCVVIEDFCDCNFSTGFEIGVFLCYRRQCICRYVCIYVYSFYIKPQMAIYWLLSQFYNDSTVKSHITTQVAQFVSITKMFAIYFVKHLAYYKASVAV